MTVYDFGCACVTLHYFSQSKGPWRCQSKPESSLFPPSVSPIQTAPPNSPDLNSITELSRVCCCFTTLSNRCNFIYCLSAGLIRNPTIRLNEMEIVSLTTWIAPLTIDTKLCNGRRRTFRTNRLFSDNEIKLDNSHLWGTELESVLRARNKTFTGDVVTFKVMGWGVNKLSGSNLTLDAWYTIFVLQILKTHRLLLKLDPSTSMFRFLKWSSATVRHMCEI